MAIVQSASLPEQRQAICRLDALADTVSREGFGSPSILIVGDVVEVGLATLCCAMPERTIAGTGAAVGQAA